MITLEIEIEMLRTAYLDNVKEILEKESLTNSTKIELIHHSYYKLDREIRRLITGTDR